MEFKEKDEGKIMKAGEDDGRSVNGEASKEVRPHYNQAWEIEIDEFEPPFPI